MIRLLYRLLIRLYPPEFRDRFGDEMLLMLEEAGAEFGPLYLLSDYTRSLGRQWACQPEVWRFAVGSLVNAALVAGLLLATEGARPMRLVPPPPAEPVYLKQRVKIYYYPPAPPLRQDTRNKRVG